MDAGINFRMMMFWLRYTVECIDFREQFFQRTAATQYFEKGLEYAINCKPSSRQYERKIDGKTEAHLIALSCGNPPAGYADWTLRLLADRVVKLEQVEIETISHETVRQVLKKSASNHGSRSNG